MKNKINKLREDQHYSETVEITTPRYDTDIISCIEDILDYLQDVERKQNEIIDQVNKLLEQNKSKTTQVIHSYVAEDNTEANNMQRGGDL